MAPVLLALGLIALGALHAGLGFLTPTSGAGRHLRAAGSSPSLQQLPTAGEQAAGTSTLAAASVGTLLVAAGVAMARRVQCRAIEDMKGTEISKDTIPRPEDLLESPKFPLYMGSTGGYMSKATRERHAITWTAKEPYFFEMPTGGVAVMNKGENLCYFRRKEQCICLGKNLRKLKIENYKIYRLRADGTVVFMHPADGVFPEKVNKGRVQVNGRPFTTCMNPEQTEVKWTKYHMKAYEADPLTTLFVKARIDAFRDKENVWVLPQPDEWITEEEWPEYTEAFNKAWAEEEKKKPQKSL